MPATTEETSVETQLALMNQMWDQHTKQDMVQFGELNESIKELGYKLDSLLLRESYDRGEATANRRNAGYIAGVVSLIVSALGVVAMFLVV